MSLVTVEEEPATSSVAELVHVWKVRDCFWPRKALLFFKVSSENYYQERDHKVILIAG